MTLASLDFYFPFFVFFYGVLVVFVIENPKLMQKARQFYPDWYKSLTSHRALGYISFFVGGLWSVQNLIFS